MAIITGQGTVTATAAVLFTVPPGPCTVLLSNAGTASPVWVGAGGGTVSPSNGFPVPSGQVPVAIPAYLGSAGTPVQACTSSGAATVGWLISTAR